MGFVFLPNCYFLSLFSKNFSPYFCNLFVIVTTFKIFKTVIPPPFLLLFCKNNQLNFLFEHQNFSAPALLVLPGENSQNCYNSIPPPLNLLIYFVATINNLNSSPSWKRGGFQALEGGKEKSVLHFSCFLSSIFSILFLRSSFLCILKYIFLYSLNIKILMSLLIIFNCMSVCTSLMQPSVLYETKRTLLFLFRKFFKLSIFLM